MTINYYLFKVISLYINSSVMDHMLFHVLIIQIYCPLQN